MKAKCLPAFLFVWESCGNAYAATQQTGSDNGVWWQSSAFWTAIFTLALTISTILLWWQTKRLAEGAEDQSCKMAASIEEMRRSADAATETAKSTPVLERAYVFLDNRIRFQRPVTWRDAEAPTICDFDVWLINHGKTAAIITKFIEMHRYCHDTSPELPEAITIPKGEVIGPGFQWQIPAHHYRVLNREWFSALNGDGFILFAGRVTYLDIFGVEHETGWCWEFNFELDRFVMSTNSSLNYQT